MKIWSVVTRAYMLRSCNSRNISIVCNPGAIFNNRFIYFRRSEMRCFIPCYVELFLWWLFTHMSMHHWLESAPSKDGEQSVPCSGNGELVSSIHIPHHFSLQRSVIVQKRKDSLSLLYFNCRYQLTNPMTCFNHTLSFSQVAHSAASVALIHAKQSELHGSASNHVCGM